MEKNRANNVLNKWKHIQEMWSKSNYLFIKMIQTTPIIAIKMVNGVTMKILFAFVLANKQFSTSFWLDTWNKLFVFIPPSASRKQYLRDINKTQQNYTSVDILFVNPKSLLEWVPFVLVIMSELQATVEVSVEFHNFYNVDLFQRG